MGKFSGISFALFPHDQNLIMATELDIRVNHDVDDAFLDIMIDSGQRQVFSRGIPISRSMI